MFLCFSIGLFCQDYNQNKFRQLYQELPTPNNFRTASGAPGHEYWQQRADYVMDIRLDDEEQKIYGEETITYWNNSPDPLKYLWVQLDQNVRAKDSDSKKISTNSIDDRMSFRSLNRMLNDFDGGFKIDHVKDASGKDLDYTINKTMMRIDLPRILAPKAKTQIKIKWWYNINDRMKIGGRSGYEYFEDDDNYLYTIAQFYPRMAVYCDNEGWQNKQFLGRGEFTLNFGNYTVNLTVPSDHVVASTGTLQNPKSVLTSAQQKRLSKARSSDKPVLIITQDEAEENEKGKEKGNKTWTFKAENVRDFGWASSRKFMWDAQGVPLSGKTVMAMSYYPKEGNPLWEKYSTAAVVQTLKTYSKHTFDYPYPKAISVNAKSIGMEYPMICFNFGRPEKDGTYGERTKYGVIGVIIHEVGHNWFPMIVSSDERQWTWMDEGLNTFLQYLTEQEFQRDFPSRRGEPRNIVNYMKGDKSKISPIMTNSESIHQFGNNAYGKPATALNILRETVMGRELFDFAFKEYSNRWKFKHPTPADFFRSMEDASAVDLDWFWRGWFYTNDAVDISLDNVAWYQIDTKNPDNENAFKREQKNAESPSLSDERNRKDIPETMVEARPELEDFYSQRDVFEANALDYEEYQSYLKKLSEDEKEIVNSGKNFYQMTFSNKGGLVMPIILEFNYTDGSKEIQHIPAEIWKMGDETINKVFVLEKELQAVTLDPYQQTADIDMSNNYWPPRAQASKFELFKGRQGGGENPMQRDRRAKENQD
ncbi:MAG: M1 family metallopeptidase [Bacteroidota bacterium]